MTTSVRPRLLIIDGHSMAYRAFFALPVENFTTVTGQPTNAVYGFTSMLATLLKAEEPTHVAVAFDVGRTSFRTQEYPEYKAGRTATPEEFKSQIPLIKQVLETLAIPALEKDGFEADDIFATLATQGAAAEMEVLVCSGDRDSFQLVGEDVTVLYPKRGVSDLARMTPAAVFEKYAVPPERYSDLAALVGESSDNLPGVPGVGPKTAAKWLSIYGDLAGILDNSAQISGKAGESLRACIDQVRRNRRLNQLVTNCDLPVSLADLVVKPWDTAAVRTMLDSLEFGSLVDRVVAASPGGVVAPEVIGVDEVSLEPVTHLEQWLQRHRDDVVGVALSGKAHPIEGALWSMAIAVVTPSGRHGIVMDLADLDATHHETLRAWLADPAAPKAVHGLKAAYHMLYAAGWSIEGVICDIELAAYICYPDHRSYEISDLAMRHLGRVLEGDLVEESGQGSLDLRLEDPQTRRGGIDAATIAELAITLNHALHDRSLMDLLTTIELPLARILAQMERVGIAVDDTYLRQLDSDFAAHVDQAAADAFAVIGRTVNLGSPKQLQEVLFTQLSMPPTKKIKTGYTTDAAALADLFARTQHPFLEHLLAHRDATKLRQTVSGLLKAVAADGRIHTTFQQTVAATGRLSSSDPNLQNIPIRTHEGRRIRQAFTVGEQFETLLTADYSQIEMRIMAHLSEDEGLIAAFQSGEDLHSFVGARVFGVSADQVTAQMRSRVKAMSYGLVYGLSAFGLSQQLNIEVGEAQRLMDDYFDRFGKVRDYLDGVVDEARGLGYTATILGRRRYLPDLTSDHRLRRQTAERMALNAPIQGSAADLVKVAMLRVDRALAESGLSSRMLLQVHDELVIEVAPGEEGMVEELVRSNMTNAATLSVPLEVSVGIGPTWHDAGH